MTRRLNRSAVLVLAAFAMVMLAALPAGAHVGQPSNGLWEGFLHPVTGPDHLLAMVAVGVVSACGAVSFRWWLAPAAFLGGMVLGGVLGIEGWGMPEAETLIVASVIALGLVVAGAAGKAGRWLLPLLVLAGLAHGNAHGLEAPDAAHPVLYIGGFLLATTLLHLTGAFGGHLTRRTPFVRLALGVLTSGAGVLLLTS